MKQPQVHITLHSDYICPWCYIAKCRMERIIELLKPEIDCHLSIRPALLYPNIPTGGIDKKVLAHKSKPGMGRSLRHEAQIEDITIDYSQIERIPNSREAHRLTALIDSDSALQLAVAKDIFHSYFSQGKNIESQSVLIEICNKNNVSKSIQEAYKNGQGKSQLDQLLMSPPKDTSINSVPTVIFNNQIVLPGLQSSEVWMKYIKRAATRL